MTRPDDPCENCGVCCFAFSLPPYDANDEADVPGELIEEIEAHARSGRHRKSDPCLWLDLDSRRCRHHDVRPVLCRWFEPGCRACSELRVKAGLPAAPRCER